MWAQVAGLGADTGTGSTPLRAELTSRVEGTAPERSSLGLLQIEPKRAVVGAEGEAVVNATQSEQR